MSVAGKKRKVAFEASERPSKKQQVAGRIKVNHLKGSPATRPVVASVPGSNLTSNLQFTSYAKKSRAEDAELLLQSSDHPTIDFTATETKNYSSADSHLKHYIAVFDPSTKRLDVTEAKHMTVKNVVRQSGPVAEESEAATTPGYASRAALTEAFGTKKSKRAVQSMTENRLLASGDQGEDDPLSQAITSTNGDDEDENDPESPQKTKPLPHANTSTSKVAEVYSLDTLVKPGVDVLESMPLDRWRSSYDKTKQIRTSSRYVSNRFGWLMPACIASPGGIHLIRLQLLRYIYLLLEIHKYMMKLNQRAPVPPPSKWPEGTISDNIREFVLNALVKRFFPDFRLSQFNFTLLRSTIFALTLHIPPPSLNPGKDMLITEPTDIELDLAMDKQESMKLWRELGCKFVKAKDSELELWGLAKLYKSRKTNDEGSSMKASTVPKFVKLSFPLDFVKVSRGKALNNTSRRR